jgi:hypothetical protein
MLCSIFSPCLTLRAYAREDGKCRYGNVGRSSAGMAMWAGGRLLLRSPYLPFGLAANNFQMGVKLKKRYLCLGMQWFRTKPLRIMPDSLASETQPLG